MEIQCLAILETIDVDMVDFLFKIINIPVTLPVILFNTSVPASLMQKNPQDAK